MLPFPGSLVEQPCGFMTTSHRLRAYQLDHAKFKADPDNCPSDIRSRVLLTAARSVGQA